MTAEKDPARPIEVWTELVRAMEQGKVKPVVFNKEYRSVLVLGVVPSADLR